MQLKDPRTLCGVGVISSFGWGYVRSILPKCFPHVYKSVNPAKKVELRLFCLVDMSKGTDGSIHLVIDQFFIPLHLFYVHYSKISYRDDKNTNSACYGTAFWIHAS